ncbi:hypothetical protein D3C72_2310790 [compost metagenome]
MGGACRNVQGVTSLERHGRLPFELIFERTLDDVGHLYAGVRMFRRHHARIEVHAHLNDFAPGDIEVAAHQVGTRKAGLPVFRRRLA